MTTFDPVQIFNWVTQPYPLWGLYDIKIEVLQALWVVLTIALVIGHWYTSRRADRYQHALARIALEGKVCARYNSCRHPGCESSYSAWAIAHQALGESEPA